MRRLTKAASLPSASIGRIVWPRRLFSLLDLWRKVENNWNCGRIESLRKGKNGSDALPCDAIYRDSRRKYLLWFGKIFSIVRPTQIEAELHIGISKMWLFLGTDVLPARLAERYFPRILEGQEQILSLRTRLFPCCTASANHKYARLRGFETVADRKQRVRRILAVSSLIVAFRVSFEQWIQLIPHFFNIF